MCSGKKTYQSKGHAFSGALGASKKTGKPMRAYPCPKCKKWHLTSKRKGEFS